MSGAFLSPEDVIAAGGFIAVVVAALGYQAIRSAMATSPRARMRQRAQETVTDVAPGVRASVAEEAEDTLRRTGVYADSKVAALLNRLYAQAQHMGGLPGLRLIGGGAVVGAVLGGVLTNLAGLSVWLMAGAALLAAPVMAAIVFRILIVRYRAAFLVGFPDALDLLVRAVRAGVPVVQAIVTAGRELPYPVGHEFRLMGDALRIGMDQQDVLEAAAKRIGVPDFNFFVLCLQLQRETGGPLAETLENLGSIIRARREVRLKTRALTAQGRASAKIIAVLPLITIGGLKAMGGDYIDILFNTASGQRLLWIAAGMVVTGLVVIERMAKLED